MNAITQIDNVSLADIVAHYGLGQVLRCQLAANGIENSNYFLTLGSYPGVEDGYTREYVLTLLEQPSNTGGRAYVELLDTGARAGLPVPQVIRNLQDQAFETLHGKTALLSRRLSGAHVLNPTRAHIAAIGRFLARFHRCAQRMASYVPRYPRDVAWLQRSLAMLDGWITYGDRRMVDAAITAIDSTLSRSDVTRLPVSVIHGDLFRDNALFKEAGLTGVVDFHHAATGYCLFDLAVSANDWCTDADGELDPELTFVLLRAYHQIRPLRREELWFFPMFSLYAGTAFYLSRACAARAQAQPGATASTRSKNPLEFQLIVARRLNQFFYPDERRLNL